MAYGDGPEGAIPVTALNGANASFIEQLFALYQRSPDAVDPSWRAFFQGIGDDAQVGQKPSWTKPNWPQAATGDLVAALDGNWAAVEDKVAKKAAAKPGASAEDVRRATQDSIRALMLIRAYRIRGHLMADLDPLGLEPPKPHPELEPQSYGFGPEDMDRPIFIDHVLGLETATMREILEILKRTYCSTIGVEFMHISDPEEKSWIQERIEGRGKEVAFTEMGKKAILNKLIEAEGFEKFCATKFTGTKRFGLDGGEALIPALEQIIKRGGALGVKEIVLGMPHRGRLNVLTTVMAKPYTAIFSEFKGGSSTPDDVEGSGDVKYHLGTSSDRSFDGNDVHLSLTANPSHLEAVNPVVLGKVRAKQTQRGDTERTQVLPVLLHGDAAFAGQGIVAECFGLSGLKGHKTGGTMHVVVNNQIGFTTAPQYSRSSPYPTDIAKMVASPIFHVNGDDPEAVVHVAKIATEFRQKFHKDVVIDIFCYRRFGHNEGDEPMFTNPIMYQRIRQHTGVLELYARRLVAEGVMTEAEVDAAKKEFVSRLEESFQAVNGYKPNKADWFEGKWAGLTAASGTYARALTGVSEEKLKQIGQVLTTVPEDHNTHRTIKRLLETKKEMFATGEGFDWATAEALAFGTLLDEGYGVRLAGQDSQRGTFSHRHSVLIDQDTEARYTPLNNIRPGQAHYEVIDSMLSEEAVLGFEYGFSLAEPNALTIWEAQFGDFTNGAQVLIDQFISSGERKWLRSTGLVMLLPHGYEGQGPEHSSARLERFLQSCAEDNMQVVNITSPANYFHALRRQLHRPFRKPLIVMAPKSLLRHKRCISPMSEFMTGESFHRVLWDSAERLPGTTIKLKPDDKIKRVIMCTGKVYYDLMDEREKQDRDDTYILRIEQLYPFPYHSVMKELHRFPNADVVWCQEEPRNMGAWSFVDPNIEFCLNKVGIKAKRPLYAGRNAAASPATGLMSKHQAEQAAFLNEAFNRKTTRRKGSVSDVPDAA